MFRGYDNADGILMNSFQNESFKHATERLTKNKYHLGKKFCKTKKGN